MTAPLVPPQRRVPSIWRRAMTGNALLPILGVGLAVPGTLGLLVGLLRGRYPSVGQAVEYAAFIATGTALLWWHVSRLRLAFVHGQEVRARVTHFAPYDWKDKATGIGPQLTGPSHYLRVVYVTQGIECVVEYALESGNVERLHPAVGGEVVLITHAQLEKPLLRDLYLDP